MKDFLSIFQINPQIKQLYYRIKDYVHYLRTGKKKEMKWKTVMK